MIFSTSFYVIFWSILNTNFEPKLVKNRFWSRFFRGPKLHRAIFKILRDVLDGMLGFAVPGPPENLPKSLQNWAKSHLGVDCFLVIFQAYFFIDFCGFWPPSWDPNFLQNRCQDRYGVKKTPYFFAFMFFRFSGVPPNEIYSIRGPFWDDFLNIFVQVLNVIVHVFFVCFLIFQSILE